MKTGITFQTSVETYRGKTNFSKRTNEVEAAVNPLTSTLLVLIKTRCRENDCREERNTSQTHKHAHAHTLNDIQRTTISCDIGEDDTRKNKTQ